MTQFEKRYIQCCRSLASHLAAYARNRSSEDKTAIASAHSELCRIWREEQGQPTDGDTIE